MNILGFFVLHLTSVKILLKTFRARWPLFILRKATGPIGPSPNRKVLWTGGLARRATGPIGPLAWREVNRWED